MCLCNIDFEMFAIDSLSQIRITFLEEEVSLSESVPRLLNVMQ